MLLTADVSATPFGMNSLGGLAGLESLGLGQSTFMDLQVTNYSHVFYKTYDHDTRFFKASF